MSVGSAGATPLSSSCQFRRAPSDSGDWASDLFQGVSSSAAGASDPEPVPRH